MLISPTTAFSGNSVIFSAALGDTLQRSFSSAKTTILKKDYNFHEAKVLDILPIEAGAFYLMDWSYLDFARCYQLHQAAAFFVIRAKRNFNAQQVYFGSGRSQYGTHQRSIGPSSGAYT